ncbi:hypothetical protein CR51_31240 [Caballeronia megalochromosomata]|nr:hypothetical protein CR51_31240 [Caballeronia megalochromosomata]
MDGFQAQATSLVSSWTVQYTQENTVGTLTEVKKGVGYTVTLNSNQDAVNHDQDVFYIWVNPQLNLYYINARLSGFSLQPQVGEDMTVIPLNARELANPQTIPNDKKQYLSKLGAKDYLDILEKDPFVITKRSPLHNQPLQPKLDPKRFYRVSTLQIWGPDSADDFVNGSGLHETVETSNGQIVETKETVQFAVLFGFSYDSIGIMLGATSGWENDNKSEMTQTSTQDIILLPLTSTIGYHAVYDVYYDSIFRTYAFVLSPNQSENLVLSGKVVRSGGLAAGAEAVTVTEANGRKVHFITNAKGEYKYYGTKNTPYTLAIGGVTHQGRFGSATQTLDVEIP